MSDGMELGNLIFGHSRGEHPIPRHEGFETEIARLLEGTFPDEDPWTRSYGVHFKNDVWECHPYCWCEREECPQCGTGEQANFKHFASGLEIRWYKYPLRDAYSNQKLTVPNLAKVVDDCLRSLPN